MSAPAMIGSHGSGRNRKGSRRRRWRGHRNGGVVPFGYRRVYESPREEWVLIREPREGPVVEAIFRGYLRHRSLAKLVSWLEEGGHRTRGGRPWSRAALAFLLGNETYLGKWKKGDPEGAARPAALVAPIVFHKVQQMKRRNAKRPAAGEGRTARAKAPANRDG